VSRAKVIRSQQGFTLVEAMVALVIFSMAAMGIYSWINTNLISLNRLAAVAESEFVVDSAVERLQLVDLRSETQGEFNVSGYQVVWRAELVEPWRQGKTQQGGLSIYDFGLYDIHLELFKDSRPQGNFHYRYTAWYMAREFKLEGDDAF
jgi:general secretion pathway protein I